MTVITGGLTAAAGVNAKTELCVTPSPGLATALRATGDGAARTVVNRVPTVTTVTKDASVRMERPVITSLGNAVVHLGTLEPCKLVCCGVAPQILHALTCVAASITTVGFRVQAPHRCGGRAVVATRAPCCLTFEC